MIHWVLVCHFLDAVEGSERADEIESESSCCVSEPTHDVDFTRWFWDGRHQHQHGLCDLEEVETHFWPDCNRSELKVWICQT